MFPTFQPLKILIFKNFNVSFQKISIDCFFFMSMNIQKNVFLLLVCRAVRDNIQSGLQSSILPGTLINSSSSFSGSQFILILLMQLVNHSSSFSCSQFILILILLMQLVHSHPHPAQVVSSSSSLSFSCSQLILILILLRGIQSVHPHPHLSHVVR